MPVSPWSTTFSPRSTNPQVASSATATLSRPRPSKKSTLEAQARMHGASQSDRSLPSGMSRPRVE